MEFEFYHDLESINKIISSLKGLKEHYNKNRRKIIILISM